MFENAQSITGRWLTVAWLDPCYMLVLPRSPWGRCLSARYFKVYFILIIDNKISPLPTATRIDSNNNNYDKLFLLSISGTFWATTHLEV